MGFHSCEMGLQGCEMRLQSCEMAHVCLGVVSQGGAWAAKFVFGRFRRPFCNCEIGFWATKWHTCAREVFRSYENSCRGWACGCKMISKRRACFATRPQFHNMVLWAAKWFRKGALLAAKFLQTSEFLCF